MKLHWMLRRYMKPDDGGEGSGGGGDRGDNFVPTGPDAEGAVAAEPDDAAVKAAAVAAVAAEKAAEEAAAAETAAAEAAAALAAEEAEGDDETKPKKKGAPRIPLERHEAILKKERDARTALEAQLAQYQNGEKVAKVNEDLTAIETKILGMEKEYAQLLTDGHVDKGAALMADIRRLEREATEAKSDMKIQVAVATATERARFNIALERVEAAYPTLNPDHADYDAALDSDVSDLKTTYERRGMTPTDALQKAVGVLAKAATAKQEAAVEVTPLAPKKDVAKELAAERKKEAVDKALKATGATPPSTAKVGLDSDQAGGTISTKDVMKMSHKDFSALPEEALSRMRGDTL